MLFVSLNVFFFSCSGFAHISFTLATIPLFGLGHQANMNGHAQHVTCVGLQHSKAMSHFAPSLFNAVTGLEAIWDKYQGTVEKMINDFIVGYCNCI